jgi:hypothetical protein
LRPQGRACAAKPGHADDFVVHDFHVEPMTVLGIRSALSSALSMLMSWLARVQLFRWPQRGSFIGKRQAI